MHSGHNSGWRVGITLVGGRVVVIIQVGGPVHSGYNSGCRAGAGNNLGDKELKCKRDKRSVEDEVVKGGGVVW